MRRAVASAVVVAAVAAVAVAAIVDAVRPHSEPPAFPAGLSAELRELDMSGTLIYTDADCELHALSLPGLVPAAVPEGQGGCEFSVSPDGSRVGPRWIRWSAGGKRCSGACAWRGEELTRARREAIRSDRDVLVPRRELVRAAAAASGAQLAPTGLRVLDFAWTRADRVVVLADARYGPLRETELVAGFEGGRLAWQRALARRLDRLVVGPQGQIAGEPADLVLADFPFPEGVSAAGPLDWSPTGFQLVLAEERTVAFFDARSRRVVRVPLTARDLAWR